MRKKFCCIILIFSAIFCTGFKSKEQPLIALTAQPVVTKQTLLHSENIFTAGTKITYMFYYPKGFGDSVLRTQLYKMNDKVQTLGFELVQSREVTVNIGDKYATDYFVVWQPGLYQVQITEIRKPRKMLKYARFRVI